MNIDEARNVLWLKSNPRPLGELLDEGFLTKDRLEWAAKWAYSSKLQQAAKVILESINHSTPILDIEKKPEALVINTKDSPIETGISFDRAYATLWPFPPYKGQSMGALAASKQLSLKDLGFAIENAWDERVRQAATVFTLIRLNQVIEEPAPSAGFVHVISGGRSYAEQRQLRLSLRQGALLGALITFLLVLLLAIIMNLFETSSTAPATVPKVVLSPAMIIAIIIVIGTTLITGWLIGYLFEKIIDRWDKQIGEHRRGQEGEDNVMQMIVQALDGNWHLFRNLSIPGRNKGDLDLVLVGPPGVWALEVKNFRGEYRNIGETWERKNGKNWKTARVNPSRQAQNSALRLKNFLNADNINVFVNSVVVWANSESQLEVENSSVTVWSYDRLADELGNIWQGEKLSQAERNKIVAKLTKLCERQKEIHS